MKLSASVQSLVDQRMYLYDFKMNLARTLQSDQLKKFTSTTTIDSEPAKTCIPHKRRPQSHKKPMAPRIPVKVAPDYGPIPVTMASSTSLEQDNIEEENESNSSIHSFSFYYTYSNNIVGGRGCSDDTDVTTAANTSLSGSEFPQMVKSKCDSPFLLRKLPRVGAGDEWTRFSQDEEANKLHLPPIAAYDSGVSSLSSAQMFFADICEFWHTPLSSASSRSHQSPQTVSDNSISFHSSESTVNSTIHFLSNKLGLLK